MNTSSVVKFNADTVVNNPITGKQYVLPLKDVVNRYWSSRFPQKTAEDVFLGGNDPIVDVPTRHMEAAEQYVTGLGSYTGFYAQRGQIDGCKNGQDHLYGKIGEFIAQEDIEKHTSLSQRVDVNIYQAKSFSPDLKSGRVAFQVKTHNVFGCGWPSWVFENVDKSIFGPNWSMPENDIIVVLVNIAYERATNGKIVRCRGKVYSYNWLSELHLAGVFLPMIKENLTTKKAIYSHSLHQLKMIHSFTDVKQKFTR